MKRIILLGTVVAVMAAMLVASSLSVSAQSTGQTAICAPWSKGWDISKGQWMYQWYRWCYDTVNFDSSYEASWYTENGTWQSADKVNLCPGSGSCTMTTQ